MQLLIHLADVARDIFDDILSRGGLIKDITTYHFPIFTMATKGSIIIAYIFPMTTINSIILCCKVFIATVSS